MTTERRQILMTFAAPPSAEDIRAMALDVVAALPHDLLRFTEDMDLVVEDFPSVEIMESLEVESEFDLLALYRNHMEKIPGVISKSPSEEPVLLLYRRPLLDLWCDTMDDLTDLVRRVIITEIAQSNGYTEEEAEDLCLRAA